jgi:hypothetical protein
MARPFKRALRVTVPEDKLGATTIGRVASCALVGRKDRRRPTLTSSAGVVILTGSSSRQRAQKPVKITVPRYYLDHAAVD